MAEKGPAARPSRPLPRLPHRDAHLSASLLPPPTEHSADPSLESLPTVFPGSRPTTDHSAHYFKVRSFEPRGGGQGQEARRELESTHSSTRRLLLWVPTLPLRRPPPTILRTGDLGQVLYLSVSASSWKDEETCVLHQAGALESPRFDLGPLLDSCPATPPSGSPYPHNPFGLEPRTQTGGQDGLPLRAGGRRQGQGSPGVESTTQAQETLRRAWPQAWKLSLGP